MNPLTNVKNINKLNEIELARGTVDKKSWHDMYKESAWIFIGGLAYGLTEGDILSVFSQYGEIVNINLIRDSKTGKIKGFCFLCYANQKSTVLAVDNFNGIKLCGRTIRVDHVANYKPPKEHENDDDITKHLKSEGCAPKPIKLESSQASDGPQVTSVKKSKKVKKEKKKHKKKRKHETKEKAHSSKNIKEEKVDPGYSKYEFPTKERVSKKKDKQIDSSDSESSSSSESTDSDSNRKKLSKFQHKVNRPDRDYKERYDNHTKTRDGASNTRKTVHKEREESSSDSQEELGGRKRLKNQDYYSSSSKNKSYQSLDHNRKRNHSEEDYQRDYQKKNDSRKSKHSSEQERPPSKHHKHYSHSSSESDALDKRKVMVAGEDKDSPAKDRNKQDESGKSYDRTHKRYESSRRHQNETDYERNSCHERYH